MAISPIPNEIAPEIAPTTAYLPTPLHQRFLFAKFIIGFAVTAIEEPIMIYSKIRMR